MGMAAILLNDADLFEQIDITSLTEGPMWHLLKIGQAFQRRYLKITWFLYMYTALGQGQITTGDKFRL